LLLSDALTYLDTLRIEAGIAAGRVVIELTESSPLARPRGTRARPPAGCVRSATASRSTMSAPTCADHRNLIDLNFTELKLDKALVRDALHDPPSYEFWPMRSPPPPPPA